MSAPLDFTPATRAVLDARAGRQLSTEDDLIAFINKLGSVRLGEVTLDYTPQALAEIKHRAEKRGISVDQLLKQIVRKLSGEILTQVPLV